MRRAFLAISMLLVTAGCTEVWYDAYWFKAGGSEAARARAEYDCDQSSFARYPPITLGHPGYFSTEQSFCSPTPNGPSCVLINPGYLPQARPANDTNEWPREQAFQSCMMAQGWHPGEGAAGSYLITPPGTSRPSRTAVRAARTWCENHLKRNGNGAISGDALDQCIVTRSNQSG